MPINLRLVHQTMSIATAATPITPVAAHPQIFMATGAVNSFICFLLPTTIIIAIMIGTATKPLMTALQNSALTGSRGTNSKLRPNGRVAKFFGGRSHAVTGCIFMLC